MHRSRAFTLIELLVVISIISLLSSVVLSALNTAREKGRVAAARSAEANLYHAAGDMLVADWEFNECSGASAADLSLSNIAVPISGSIAWSADTQSGTGCSASFPGNQSISLGGSSNYPDESEAKTISVWAKYSTVPTQSDLVFFGISGSYATQFGYMGGIPTVWKWGGTTLARGTAVVSAGVWHNYIYTYDGTKSRLFVDGSEVGSSATAPQSGASNVYLGGYGAEYFNGLIDSVRIYAKGLTATEASKLYASEKLRFNSLARE